MSRPAPRHLLACLIGAGVLGLAASTVAAQTVGAVALDTAAPAQADGDATEAATDETRAAAAAEAERAAQRDADRNCLRYTGTRIVARARPGRPCVAQHGRVYTREDLNTTGEVDVARALRKLDTSFGW